MTPATAEQLSYELAEQSLSDFIVEGWRYIDPAPFIGNWHIDRIAEHLEAVANGECKRLIIMMPPRHMKQMADSTPVPTPDGIRRHGDLRVGDFVFGPDGKSTRIVRVTPKSISDREVVFSNGDVAKVNGDHLWTVVDRGNRNRRVTLDTNAIAAAKPHKGRCRFQLPDFEPLQWPEAELPLHPYFLGCWLGDGKSTGSCIAHDRRDRAHIEKIEALGYAVSATWENGGNGVQSNFGGSGVNQALRGLGIFGEKRIPERYQQSALDQRLELLAGLIDTDGHVERRTGRVRISTTCPLLAADIERLAFSVGFRPYVFETDAPGYGDYAAGNARVYQVGFQPNRTIPTALDRKKIIRTNAKRRRVGIVEVRPAAEPEPGNCITVEREDGLYLACRTHIVTHNSLSVNVAFPAWVWAQKKRSPLTGPGTAFLSTSYAQSLSIRDNVKCRRLIESPWYRRGWGDRFVLTSDQNTKVRYENNAGGYRIASSVDGSATGEGGDIVIIDDAISANDAQSPTIRAAANEWFDNTMTTRLNDPKNGAYIIVMQRLHEDDLVGHILARSSDDWTVLCLPARYEPDHPHVYAGDPRKVPGELLWPKRMGEKEVRSLEIALTSYGAAGQLQQRPAPRDGGMFRREWFEVVPAHPPLVDMVRAWDLAATVPTPGADPDWTVGVKMGRCADGFIWILDVVRVQLSAHNVETLIKNTASQDTKKCRVRLPQDPGQAGKSQASALVRKLAGFVVKAVPPTGAKDVRATPFAGQAEANNVKLLEGDWNSAFFDEIEVFPFAKHDDQVDAAADAFNELFEGEDGFLNMVREDNRESDTKKAEIAAKAVAAAEAAKIEVAKASCPHPKGSLEYLQFMGLIPPA